ncbi:MAG: hypothetical protein ACREOW_17265 [Thermodesulfobacteriota bacterium]
MKDPKKTILRVLIFKQTASSVIANSAEQINTTRRDCFTEFTLNTFASLSVNSVNVFAMTDKRMLSMAEKAVIASD